MNSRNCSTSQTVTNSFLAPRTAARTPPRWPQPRSGNPLRETWESGPYNRSWRSLTVQVRRLRFRKSAPASPPASASDRPAVRNPRTAPEPPSESPYYADIPFLSAAIRCLPGKTSTAPEKPFPCSHGRHGGTAGCCMPMSGAQHPHSAPRQNGKQPLCW